jgi:uncharacterized protein YciI
MIYENLFLVYRHKQNSEFLKVIIREINLIPIQLTIMKPNEFKQEKNQLYMSKKSSINHFYAIIKPYREDFLINIQEEESKIMSDHFLYLQELLNCGKLFLAGPTLIKSEPFGVIILETASIEEARILLENDPSVKKGIQKINDLRPMRVSLYKNMENRIMD